MMYREHEQLLKNFYTNNHNKAVMLLGPRQVGKTYTIKKFAEKNYKSVVVIDFVKDESNKELINSASSAEDIMIRISVKYGKKLIPNNTIIFFDEVQLVPNIIAHIKYLVQEYPYDFILSGSLLGAILKDVVSIPVGYIDIWNMWPLSFKEFLIENGTDKALFSHLQECLTNKTKIDDYIHNYFLKQFKTYLITGGMPEVLNTYFSTHNLSDVRDVQKSIIKTYKADISKYNSKNKLDLNEIYDAIPSELNCQNKKFILKTLNQNARFSKYKQPFYWLKNAGVVIPAYNCSEAKIPLKLTKKVSQFKLFMCDVGLLTYHYGQNAQIQILQNNDNINCGAIYENAMAQMLMLNNEELYYYNSKKFGEIDFMIETPEGISAIEVKSGKDYYRHSALNNMLQNGICKYATVACNSNIEEKDNILYLPIYIFGFLKEKDARDIKF